MNNRSAIVLVHGCHVDATHWKEIIWGNPEKGIFGRAATALKWAVMFDDDQGHVEQIIWGTGASSRDGVSEARLIFEQACNVRSVSELFPEAEYSFSEVVRWLMSMSVIDDQSQNTRQELESALTQCADEGISQLTIVSSPWHILRCYKEALSLTKQEKYRGISIIPVASDDSHPHLKVEDVVIIEPPHRGDDPALCARHKMHLVVPKLFSLDHTKRENLLGALSANIPSQ